MKQNTYYIFKQVNIKKYMSVSYFEINSLDDFRIYMQKGDIVKYEGNYYAYKGDKDYYTTDKVETKILVMKGSKTIHEIKY